MMPIRKLLFSTAVFVVGLVGRALALYIVLFFLVFVLSFVKSADQYPVLRGLMKIEKAVENPAVSLMRNNLPTKFGGTDYAPWIFIGTVILVWRSVESRQARFYVKVREWKETRKSAIEGASREKLLELYAETKRSLESQNRLLAFLAIDVVNSTGMKVGEDPAIAERDFRKYKLMVEEVIKENGYLKAAWTPDGAMICFPSVESAVKAGQSVMNQLERFNKNVKAMKNDFKIRVGINAGTVMYDESVPMEEMSSWEIDIAGHMQKYAGENAIYISQEALESAGRDFGFKSADRVVDDRQVYEWKSGGGAA